MNYTWEPIKNEAIKWVGIDFDNTICHNSGHPDYIPTTPLDGAVEALKLLAFKGYKITIWTARHWADYHNIEKYCEHYGIPFRRIICGKPLFHFTKDDKNLGDPNWEATLRHIKELPDVDNISQNL